MRAPSLATTQLLRVAVAATVLMFLSTVVSGCGGSRPSAEEGFAAGVRKACDSYTAEINDRTDHGSFTVDPSKQPKEMDIQPESADGKLLGIYEIEDGQFKLCVAKAGETERPSEFKTKEGSPNVYIVMKKQE